MLFLLAAVYACIDLREIFPKGSAIREGLKSWRLMLGLSDLILAVPRVVARLTSTLPRVEPEAPGWQKMLAKLMHYALYGLGIGNA